MFTPWVIQYLRLINGVNPLTMEVRGDDKMICSKQESLNKVLSANSEDTDIW